MPSENFGVTDKVFDITGLKIIFLLGVLSKTEIKLKVGFFFNSRECEMCPSHEY